jgi:hypothetical protein
MVRGERYCAKCDHFSCKDTPEEAKLGAGKCLMFDNMVQWNGRWCVLFTKAKNMSVRQPWIAKQIQKLEESKNGKTES